MAAALAAISMLIGAPDSSGWLAGAVLAATVAAAVAELARIAPSHGRVRLAWSMTSVATATLVLTLGPVVAVVGMAIGTLAAGTIRRDELGTTFMRAAAAVLSTTIAAGTFMVAGGTPGILDLPAGFMPVVAMVVAYSLFQPLVAFLVTPPATDARWRRSFADEARALAPRAARRASEAITGVLAAVLIIEIPLATPLLVPVLLATFDALRRQQELEALGDRALESFAAILDERDHYTGQHSLRVARGALRVGELLGLPGERLERLYWTARLHDLGKVAIDGAILNKDGRLTEEEFEVIRLHPLVSARILRSFSFDEVDTEIVLCHHERFDGNGYLRRRPESVPLESFIIAVVDSYDAMTSERPYHDAMSPEAALREIAGQVGTQFHPDVAQAFLADMGYDPGASIDGSVKPAGPAGRFDDVVVHPDAWNEDEDSSTGTGRRAA